MNSKNIKKALGMKLKYWIDSIEDEEVKKVVKANAIISGGALVSLLTGIDVNDYDVYLKTKEAVLTVANYYVNQFNRTHDVVATLIDDGERIKIFISSDGVAGEEEEQDDSPFDVAIDEVVLIEETSKEEEKAKYRPVFITSNAISLSDKIQVVIRFWGDVEEIHKNYDFAHCTCSWSAWDNNLMLPTKALECIINKELYYMGSKYPLCSIIRTRKFLERGYTINAGQYLKMCLQLNELNLKDIEVLKEQLVGVDSTYFTIMINAMQEKIEKDKEWKADNNYLIELVNRIF